MAGDDPLPLLVTVAPTGATVVRDKRWTCDGPETGSSGLGAFLFRAAGRGPARAVRAGLAAPGVAGVPARGGPRRPRREAAL